MKSKYSPVHEVEEVIMTSVDDESIIRSPKLIDTKCSITLWCFRVIFTVGVIVVWGLSLNFSNMQVKDFFSYCKSHDCITVINEHNQRLPMLFLNDTYCTVQYNISSLNDSHKTFITLYAPTQCQLQVNDECVLMMTLTWMLPFLGMLFSGEGSTEIIWRRFCFAVELAINFFIFCNNVYIFMIIDSVVLYLWFVGTPFMCQKQKIIR